MVDEVAERGITNVSVAHVTLRSGVSRRTFYEIFEDREDCALAAFEDALSSFAKVVVGAYERSGTWRAGVREGLAALLECLECEPARARLLIVESLAAGPRVLERRRQVMAQLAQIVDRGRAAARNSDLPPLTADGIVGGAVSVIHARLIEQNDGGLLDLAGPLMGMIVLPYLGPAAARGEIESPAPERPAKLRPMRTSDPLQALEIRLTYRTMRVLVAIARNPGSSNRKIGEAADIGDQGQVSKLLSRLRRFGLVENHGVGAAARGEANAWQLSATGYDIYETIASLDN